MAIWTIFRIFVSMKIVETQIELDLLKSTLEEDISIIFPMWIDDELHPNNTVLSFLFVRVGGSDYIVSSQHCDTLSLTKSDIEDMMNTAGDKFVFQKKKLIQSLDIHTNLYDIETAIFLKTGQTLDYTEPFKGLVTPLYRMGYRDNLIQSIPILKLGEVIQQFISKHSDFHITDYNYKWYNDIFIPTLSKIEKYGIRVDRKKFTDRFSQSAKQLSTDNLIFTEYNPYTVTGRPSNRHGGVNFSALNKSDGTRDVFVSDGIFLQMDYDAYHPRLIGELIGYTLPKTSVHRWLAEQYGCSYEEGKAVTFQLLYGGIDDEFRQIPYFNGVADYIIELWKAVSAVGYLQTRYRRIPLSWIADPNPQKVFNYLLQALETEINMDIVGEVLEYIKDTDIKLSLYVYDSFLFDYPIDADTELAKGLKAIIESKGFPIKASWGTDYGKV